jgi:hypothetical protein
MRVNSGVKYDLYDLDSSAMGVPTGIKTTRYTCM